MDTSRDDHIRISHDEAQDIVDVLRHFAEHCDGSDEWAWQAENLAQNLARRLPTRQPAGD
ncbi:hypothetical protein [Streptomyces sp. TLI_146]|uniref:hypothetical protein n=1 Tax=Streptomyces sp. TLI_146 TaxID=1938858 RepID=UPI000C700BE5|nr:hypothetical protein [Streptomyces sp. TLI_146]PKV82752.1 hypothetical protein BX283_0200 [Streptomyces sp. TLI_146]